MIMTVDVEGKLFVTDEDISRFWQRAKSGEFAKNPRCAAAKHEKKRQSRSRLSQLLAMPQAINYATNSQAGVAKWQTHRT